jgi:hypothetical protein
VPNVVTDTLVEPSVIYAFVLALGFVGLIGTPLAMLLARVLGVVDQPGWPSDPHATRSRSSAGSGSWRACSWPRRRTCR